MSRRRADLEPISVLLVLWGAWRNDRRVIRKLTGCGPGHIDEAGPPARKVHGAPPTGEVWRDDPVSLVDEETLMEVDRAVAELPPGRRVVVIVEYRMRGLSRAERAGKIGIKPGAYAERLLQAKIALKGALLV